MKKEIKFAHNAELQEPRKTVKKPGFSDFRDCIVEALRSVAERSVAERSIA